MLKHKETAPDIDKLEKILDKIDFSPEIRAIVKNTTIQYDNALEILSQ